MAEYQIPLELFNCEKRKPDISEAWVQKTKATVQSVFDEYGVGAEISSVAFGPTVSTLRITVRKNVSPKRILALKDEFSSRLGTFGVRCYQNYAEGLVCIEVPNESRCFVGLGELLCSEEMQTAKAHELKVAMGKDFRGNTAVYDLSKMVHTLIAGTTGSGKSVFLHSLIASLLYKHSPQELQFVLIDPKKIEFAAYSGLPHLITGEPIADVSSSIAALDWAVAEMDRRYGLLEKLSREGEYVMNVDQYNQRMESDGEKLPKIVMIIDELADLMLVNKRDMESRIQRLTQKSRAAGIYLIAATQRATADVLTGVVKSNFLTRIAFHVVSETDSRSILNYTGAQELLGNGDYLCSRPVSNDVERIQAPYISMETVIKLVEYVKANDPSEHAAHAVQFTAKNGAKDEDEDEEVEPIYLEALKIVVQSGSVSISMIQRKCSIGYNKAGRIIEWMEANGYVSKYQNRIDRKVLLTMEEFEKTFGDKGGF